ncbi:MAG: hypothetical protein JXX28_19185 [Deltaproteobacteria bacterium]|nr:hypothetical protein [Deltaproteobacteria bacterium]
MLELGVLWAEWPAPLGSLSAPGWLDLLTGAEAEVALPPPDALVRREVRGLLRQGGFSPSGRNKPCSEWIAGVASKGDFPRISPAVDACNAACLHGGLPISTVDADRLVGALRVDVAPVGSEYVFNRSGQVLRLAGLLCLFDQEGPCANAVKDAQRTKTDEGTVRTLSLVWGTRALPGKTEEIVGWYRGVMERLGAEVALG